MFRGVSQCPSRHRTPQIGDVVAKRFNPPPNWPQPPTGWTPPPGWTPDPTWAPAPTGWSLWVDDGPTDAYGIEDADARQAPGYGASPEDDNPGKRRKWPFVVGAVAAMVVFAQCTGGSQDSAETLTTNQSPAAAEPAEAVVEPPLEDDANEAEAPEDQPSSPTPEPVAEVVPEAPAGSGYGDYPEDQRTFLDLVTTAQATARTAENDMQVASAKATRDAGVCSLLPGRTVSSWTGKLVELDANGDGKGILAVELAEDVEVATWNNFLSDAGDNTLIEPDSPVFAAAASLAEGEIVQFSGELLSGFDHDCLKDSRMTLRGGVEDPRFVFRFSEVAAAE